MKSTLYLKFIILYIIFGFLSLFATATLSPQLIKDRLEESTSQTLFKEAHLISNEYLPSYFAGNMTSWSVHSQLTAMKLYLGSSLWFVDKAGVLITSSNLDDNIAPETIEDFDPAEIGNNQYITGIIMAILMRMLSPSWRLSHKVLQQKDICSYTVLFLLLTKLARI